MLTYCDNLRKLLQWIFPRSSHNYPNMFQDHWNHLFPHSNKQRMDFSGHATASFKHNGSLVPTLRRFRSHGEVPCRCPVQSAVEPRSSGRCWFRTTYTYAERNMRTFPRQESIGVWKESHITTHVYRYRFYICKIKRICTTVMGCIADPRCSFIGSGNGPNLTPKQPQSLVYVFPILLQSFQYCLIWTTQSLDTWSGYGSRVWIINDNTIP